MNIISSIFYCLLFLASSVILPANALRGVNCFGSNPVSFEYSGVDTTAPNFINGNPASTQDLFASQSMPVNLTVAFIGDSAINSNAVAVLNLIKNNAVEMVIHSGDFDYVDNPAAFENHVNNVLGSNYPYFQGIGNHDCARWSGSTGYQKNIYDRIKRIGRDVTCLGEVGTNMVCSYKGLAFVLSSFGTALPTCYSYCGGCPTVLGQSAFIEKAFTAFPAKWRICSWHKNHRQLQIGGKQTEVGLPIYDTCRKMGALITTGHEHSYSRTVRMSSFENFAINSSSSGSEIAIDEGNTVAWVSGVAGYDLRTADVTLASNPWWASTAASSGAAQTAGYGALICKFNLNGDTSKALCEMKVTDGRILDSFIVRSDLPEPSLNLSDPSSNVTEICSTSVDVEVQVGATEANAIEDFTTGSVACPSSGALIVGLNSTVVLRFLNVSIANSEPLSSAFLELSSTAEDAGAFSWDIYAELSATPAPIACGSTSTITSRTRTSSKVTWSGSTTWLFGGVYKSPDLSAVIQEVVSLPAWTPGQPINVIILASSTSSNRRIMSYGYDRCQAPTLSINTDAAGKLTCIKHDVALAVQSTGALSAPPVAAPVGSPIDAPIAGYPVNVPAAVADSPASLPVLTPVSSPPIGSASNPGPLPPLVVVPVASAVLTMYQPSLLFCSFIIALCGLLSLISL